MDDREHGARLALLFLDMCEKQNATGAALLNAMGNALVSFFMETPFETQADRLTEVDSWCATLRKEVETAPPWQAPRRRHLS